MVALPEPWMRGPIDGVHPFLAPVLYSFQMAREDLEEFTAGLADASIWATPHGLTYLQGRELTAAQLDALSAEKLPASLSRQELLAGLSKAFHEAETVIRSIDPATLAEARTVGRQRLPTTVIGLLTHIAEHTQRHVGQAIVAAKLVALLS
jgi:hypothetical protein